MANGTGAYLLLRLPLVFLFFGGYIAYRLAAVTGLSELFVLWLLRKSGGRAGAMVLLIMFGTALLSFFIPNTVAVLTLLPVITTLRDDFTADGADFSKATTALTLAVIYGGNIGGMGSLIGSPANLVLVGALDFFKVPGRENITFGSWFVWSLPLVAVFLGVAWLLLRFCVIPKQLMRHRISLPPFCTLESGPQGRRALRIFLAFLVFWAVEAVFKELLGLTPVVEAGMCALFSGVFIFLCFVPNRDGALLRFSDLYRGLPRRGLLFLGLLAVLIGTVRWLGLDKLAADAIKGVVSPQMPMFVLFFLLTLAVIFLTEIFSNTAVSAAFFAVSYFASQAHPAGALALMTAVSTASTCAFMTPIATPANALAFGEMRGTSLRAMLLFGFALNIVGALLMSLWLPYIIPVVWG